MLHMSMLSMKKKITMETSELSINSYSESNQSWKTQGIWRCVSLALAFVVFCLSVSCSEIHALTYYTLGGETRPSSALTRCNLCPANICARKKIPSIFRRAHRVNFRFFSICKNGSLRYYSTFLLSIIKLTTGFRCRDRVPKLRDAFGQRQRMPVGLSLSLTMADFMASAADHPIYVILSEQCVRVWMRTCVECSDSEDVLKILFYVR